MHQFSCALADIDGSGSCDGLLQAKAPSTREVSGLAIAPDGTGGVWAAIHKNIAGAMVMDGGYTYPIPSSPQQRFSFRPSESGSFLWKISGLRHQGEPVVEWVQHVFANGGSRLNFVTSVASDGQGGAFLTGTFDGRPNWYLGRSSYDGPTFGSRGWFVLPESSTIDGFVIWVHDVSVATGARRLTMIGRSSANLAAPWNSVYFRPRAITSDGAGGAIVAGDMRGTIELSTEQAFLRSILESRPLPSQAPSESDEFKARSVELKKLKDKFDVR